MKLPYFFLLIFFPLLSNSQLKPLAIGDAVPDILLTNIINYKTTSAKLADFNDQLLILDFWASWCTTCLKGFPKLNTLQRQFNDRVQLLLVNSTSAGDSAGKAAAFYKKQNNKAGSSYTVPSIVGDTMLDKLFPHTAIPHCVWIHRGKLIAITYAEELTPENIHAILDDCPLSLPIKDDETQRRKNKTK